MIHHIVNSDLFLLTLTVGFYCAGTAIFRRTKIMILHPALLTFVAIIAMLKWFGVEYEQYREATGILDFALGLSVVALGYLMYEQTDRIRGRHATDSRIDRSRMSGRNIKRRIHRAGIRSRTRDSNVDSA